MKGRFLFVFFVFMGCLQASGQSYVIDSLVNILKLEKDDSNKVNTLNLISHHYWGKARYDSSLICANAALELANTISYKKGEGAAYYNIGIIDWYQGYYPKALEYMFKALNVYQEIKNENYTAKALGGVGIIYAEEGNYVMAKDYYLKALAINSKINDKRGIANNLGNLGNIYFIEANNTNSLRGKDTFYQKSLEYYFKALDLAKETGEKGGIAYNICCIGGIYSDLAYFVNPTGHKRDSLFKKALEYTSEALTLCRKLEAKEGIINNLQNIGVVYAREKNYKLSKLFLDSAMALSRSIKENEDIEKTYINLTYIDSATNNFQTAFSDYKNYIFYRDSLINEANNKKMIQAQMNYDFRRKTDSTKAEQDKLNVLAERKSQHQKMILYAFVGGFVLMVALALFIFLGYRQKQKANIIITQQKEEVEVKNEEVEKQKTQLEIQKTLLEEKNKDILDSITYAKRLQEAILPPMKFIKKFFPESFVLYKPKDIVAGDFYWMEQAGENILIAAADCTGHGVPGALVSVICSNALNRTVKEFQITDPGKVLDKVRELVCETFEKSEANVQDGMDISLFCMNTKTQQYQWSGAYNSLLYIHGREIKEVLADKQPIGKTDNPQSFHTYALQIVKGDTLYLFTDGYADQFGGPKGKKFKYKQVQEVLLANATKPMNEQKNILENTINAWKGDMEQIDDILIIGIKV